MLLKPLKLAIVCVLVCCSQLSSAQELITLLNIRNPKDTASSNAAVHALKHFLDAKAGAAKDNTFVWKDELIATSDLLDEMKGMDDDAQLKEKGYYKCFITNIIEKDSDNYFFQISYIHPAVDYPTLRANFTLLAKKVDGHFLIYSPLKQNTVAWRTKVYGNLTCHYKTSFNEGDVKAYQKQVHFYNQKLGLSDQPIDFYYCDDFTEVQHILGIDYKSDYNGLNSNSLTAHENGATLVISGDPEHPHGFDAHDLWHERLRVAVSASTINRPVDEGCAYLYGGSWGYSWDEIKTRFKNYVAANPNADWMSLYTNSTPFETGEKPMFVAYMLDALIVQKVEKEKGFAPVLQLLTCGPRQKGDDNYFATLEKVTGITKADFNTEMWKLVRAEK
jgi:hypothetical protein